ncbi:ABC transporter permease [Mesorhizobium sp. WSM4887]|uniref:ABC transporter permease n=1 Tax=Mesorhizobium sp. WSM4887 TaxID=3038543 RepID=UPI00241769A1|nr:ABC transporter permease [Mesorhizobium sp. WSM4887]MDG4889834.1 ABC transporter permease [Mesorhizobium sp. WSM4887]
MRNANSLAVRLIRTISVPLFAVATALVVGAVLIALLGQNPFTVYQVLIAGGLSGWPNISTTLQMMTPLLFTGLSVAIAFRAGLWNIGAEGQMLMGAMASAIAGYGIVGLPVAIHLPICIIAGFLGGMAWAAIPGLLRVYLAVNELVICLMLNPIALLLTGYISTRALKAPGPTNKLPDVAESAFLPSLSIFSQLNAGIFLAIGVCITFAIFNSATLRGFIWKLIGLNPKFAHYGGIDVRGNALWVMLISGGVAGLAGAEQVLGEYHAFYDNFSPGFGFDGIAVAMLAQNNPIGVIAAAFLFGVLNGGSAVLQMTTGLSKYFVQVLQFLIVLVLAAQFTWRLNWPRRSNNSPKSLSQPAIKEA